MPLTLSQIRTTITRDQALTSILTVLQGAGFSTTSWQSGSVQLTFLSGAAEAWSQLSRLADALSRICFNDNAEGEALTAFADSHYDNQRVTATRTVGLATLTCAVGAGPYAIAIGQLVAADATNGYTYRNTTGGALAGGGVLQLSWQSEVAGADYNVANGTITVLQVALAGVTIDNPDPGTGSWITSAGIDVETDPTLRVRNSTKWSTLSYASPSDAYVQFALAADADAVRVYVDDSAATGGVVAVYVAGSAGVVGAGVIANVQDEIDLKRPVTAGVTAYASAAQVQNFTADVYVTTALHDAAKETEIEAALDAYINGLPISGTTIPAVSPPGYMLHSELTQAVSEVVGVQYVNWTTPTTNVAVTATEVMTVGVTTFTYHNI